MARKIFAFITKEDLDPNTVAGVKKFLLAVVNGRSPSWPGYSCEIYVDGIPRRVLSGGWTLYNNEVCVGSGEYFDWVPGVLLAIAQKFYLHEDPEVMDGLTEFLAKFLAGVVNPFEQCLAQSFGGLELTELAINGETKALAAKFPPEEIGGDPTYRLPNGEIVEIDSNWTTFTIS